MDPEPVTIGLTIVSGNNQIAGSGLPLPNPIVVRVANSADVAIQGQIVTFTVTSGRGSLSSATATSAANGHASVLWTLGDEEGTQMVRAAVGAASVSFSAFAGAPDAIVDPVGSGG